MTRCAGFPPKSLICAIDEVKEEVLCFNAFDYISGGLLERREASRYLTKRAALCQLLNRRLRDRMSVGVVGGG